MDPLNDVIAMLYMLLFLQEGRLPWSDLQYRQLLKTSNKIDGDYLTSLYQMKENFHFSLRNKDGKLSSEFNLKNNRQEIGNNPEVTYSSRR